jgi:riboflavin kinase/FMN adenylyltransferase
MKVVSLPDLTEKRERRVAIGTFDGVHVGHREVIRGCDTVLTFNPHPLSVVRPEAAPKLLTPFNVKRDIIAGLGVDELVVIPFDDDFRQKTAEQFIDEVLIDKLGAIEVSVGENFNFGKKAQGNVEMLRARPEFETRVAPLVEVDGETVSSTPDSNHTPRFVNVLEARIFWGSCSSKACWLPPKRSRRASPGGSRLGP